MKANCISSFSVWSVSLWTYKHVFFSSSQHYETLIKVQYPYHFGGHAVEQLVEALRNKPEGRGFDSRWCHWKFLFK
jgi:hypothetical protein